MHQKFHAHPPLASKSPQADFHHDAPTRAFTTPSADQELQRQLTFTTSSQKKRRITRPSTEEHEQDQQQNTSPSDQVLPSTEDEPDPSFSFSTTSPSGFSTPIYVRGDSLPASGIPPRLQTNHSLRSVTATDYTSSAASSPCAASADLSIDNDRGPEFLDSGAALPPSNLTGARAQSALVNTPHRAVIGGAADLHQRSSSPLKRRASSMDPPQGIADVKEEDVDMITIPEAQRQKQDQDSPREESQSGVGDATGAETGSTDSQQTLAPEQELPIRTDAVPPVAEQIKTIEILVKRFAETPVQEGDTAYLVSRQWLGRALALGSKGATKELSTDSSSGPGPVDNSDIIHSIFTDATGVELVKLKPGAGVENFELFPKEAWDLLVSWYGLAASQKPIARTAHNTAQDSITPSNVQFEFHPPVFTIHRLWSANSPLPIEQQLKERNPAPAVIVHSTAFRFHDFLKQVKQHAGVALTQKIRLWRVLQTLPTDEPSSKPSGISTPPDSPGRDNNATGTSWPRLLLEVDHFVKLERGVERDLVEGNDTTHYARYNGNRSLATVNLTVDQTLVIDEYVDNNINVSNYLPRGAGKDTALAPRGSSSSLMAQARGNASGRSSPAPQGPATRGRTQQQKSGRTIGCVGLQNLGNTCYMNSALQCVRSVEELTKYFLSREAEKEINPDNPLSHNGDVARAYGRLLQEIYKDPPPSSVAPRQFKGVIGRYAPSFSGYGQQDSQEFLGFLLDGLQEDLNRIKKKPYIEKPDSTDEMINNPEAIREMAEKVWDITKKRDDSVIADLFTGMYKSTLVCPVCAKVSITFDPFTNLTLPLPVANAWSRLVKYYPLNDAPVHIAVDIDKNSSFKVLKGFISARVGVPVERLGAAEEYRNKFFKLYEDASSVSEEVQANDLAAVHELEAVPTNVGIAPKPKKKNRSLLDLEAEPEDVSPPWDDPAAQRLLVPVVHRLISEESGYQRRAARKGPLASPPHFIMLTPQEARSEDAIRRKILEKVATFTTWPEFARMDESETTDNTDADIVNTSSDADSAGDSNVVAKSVEGEEGLVDVTMNDVDNNQKPAASPASQEYPHLLKKFNSRRPKWLDPRQFLDPNLQNLFELSYFTEGNASIPNGWQVVQDENRMPRLSTRQPKQELLELEDAQGVGAYPASDDSGSEDAAYPEANPTTRMVDESSEEDSDFPKAKNLNPRPNGNRFNQISGRSKKKMKPHKTYGKKGKRRLAKQLHSSYREPSPDVADSEVSDETEGGPLVRLGEGLVVDWSEQAWDCLFAGDPQDDMRGMPTFVDVPKLDDPALEAKKKKVQARRKHGISLDDCLAEFEREEILSEQDTWYCPRCKEHRRATKKFDLWKTPDILAVHLKRFSSAGYRREKLDILVDFPVEGLDLSQRVIHREDGKQEVYDLIAVDDHWGGLGGGHYTAFAKNFVDEQWYEYNDTSVSRQSDVSRIVTSAAYLLFYRRRSDTALGGPRFQEILSKYNNQADQADDDEMSDSGEGQRLGQGSSLRGSSSALTGAGLTPQDGDRGSASGYTDGLGRSIHSEPGVDRPPAYTATYNSNLEELVEASDDASGDAPDAESMSGMGIIQWDNSPVRHSPEAPAEDEGIDMEEFRGPSARQSTIDAMTNVMSANWNFHALDARARSEAESDFDDLASDRAQNDSSDDGRASFVAAGDHPDVDPMLEDNPEPGADYVLPDQAEPDSPRYNLPPPPPAFDDQAHLHQITEGVWDSKVYKVPVDLGDPEDDASDKVYEIHLGDEKVDKADTKKV